MRYSNDFRRKAVESVLIEKNKKHTVAKVLKISRTTLDGWLALEKTSSLYKPPIWSKAPVLPSIVFEQYFNNTANQDKYLKEIAQDLNVSATSIQRVKVKLNITRKKNKNHSKKQIQRKEINL
jgi:transposase